MLGRILRKATRQTIFGPDQMRPVRRYFFREAFAKLEEKRKSKQPKRPK